MRRSTYLDPSKYLQPLLSHPKLLGAFAKFVEATGRFPDLV
jgi:hypothetical protein